MPSVKALPPRLRRSALGRTRAFRTRALWKPRSEYSPITIGPSRWATTARAYRDWARDGSASGKKLDEFTAGFAETKRAQLVRSVPYRIEGAAGSRYLDVQVAVEALTRAGEVQRFEGTYTLRRSEVDGATADQRRWHIESAKVRKVE